MKHGDKNKLPFKSQIIERRNREKLIRLRAVVKHPLVDKVFTVIAYESADFNHGILFGVKNELVFYIH